MKAVCLLVVFLVAKILVLAGRPIDISIWTPLAYFWQDLIVVLLFAGLDFVTQRRPWIGWLAYGLLVVYVAVNVPIACLLSTPMTWPLLRATRGTLADSIAYHVTWINMLRIILVLAVGAGLPILIRRLPIILPRRVKMTTSIAAMALILIGPMASAQVETMGLDRNPLIALITSAIPRVPAMELAGDWRTSPFENKRDTDLTGLRAAAAGRNVIVIHLESTGAQYLRPFGADEDPMPRLTALARQSIVFENAYTTYPETIRSFFAVQCSTFPALDTQPEDYEHVQTPGLAQTLEDAGYRTGLFHSGRFMYLGMESVIRNRGYQTLEDAGDIGGVRESSFGIDEPSTVRRILSWIDAAPHDRFFVSYLPIAGHHPYATSTRGAFPEDTEIGRYRNALHEADAALGQLLDGLRKRGLLNNTLLVLFGDHGEAFGQHPGNYGHTLFIYEENIHVPLIFSAPGLFKEHTEVARVASLVDVTPTILDLLGLSRPAAYQGRSLLEDRSQMALFATDYSLGFLGLRDGRWKLIHELESGRSWLYDLSTDPQESCNLADRFPERAAEYRQHLLRWSAAQKYRIKAEINKA
jgi:glucan phosphoethanolaminetransferase (alkaline phosphatase superfamily)